MESCSLPTSLYAGWIEALLEFTVLALAKSTNYMYALDHVEMRSWSFIYWFQPRARKAAFTQS